VGVSEEPLRYAVLLAKPEDFKALELARALAAMRKVPEQDMIPAAKRSWGIVEQDLSQEQAAELEGGLSKAGIASFSLPSKLIEELPPVQAMKAMASFKPERLVVLAAAALKITETHTVKTTEGPDATQRAISMGLMAAGIPIRVGGKKREVEKTVETSDLVFFIDLCLKDPVERFRIDAQHFDYAVLGARKTYSVIINFRQLLCDFADAHPGSLKSRGSLILLDQKPVRDMGYESLKDLERECRWLSTLATLKR
jgi:hypothetical protein